MGLFLFHRRSLICAFVIRGVQARTLAQHLLEICRATVLLQQVAKSLVGQFLDRFYAVEREPMHSLPSLTIEYDALSDLACGCASD